MKKWLKKVTGIEAEEKRLAEEAAALEAKEMESLKKRDPKAYATKRKEALTIYAERLSKQILEDKQEVMLEPMNSVDRKTLHDAAATFDGIRSYSEGREPYRSVVFAPEEEE